MKKYFALLLIGLVACHKPNYSSISDPFEPDYKLDRLEATILRYEEEDKIAPPQKQGAIVFAGSSSFTLWKSAKDDLAPLPIINRGFGGSTLPEVIHYADRTIFKYNPSTVVVYCENDMFGKKVKTPEQTRDAYVELTRLIRQRLPDVQMYYVSMKPSPSRWGRREDVIKANELIKRFVKSDRKHEYIDVWPVMLKDGRPDGSIFLKDSLHMNKEGYSRWIGVLKPILEKKK
jgi:lysophospholipase L1-like esterase